jgi:hypothetical protein
MRRRCDRGGAGGRGVRKLGGRGLLHPPPICGVHGALVSDFVRVPARRERRRRCSRRGRRDAFFRRGRGGRGCGGRGRGGGRSAAADQSSCGRRRRRRRWRCGGRSGWRARALCGLGTAGAVRRGLAAPRLHEPELRRDVRERASGRRRRSRSCERPDDVRAVGDERLLCRGPSARHVHAHQLQGRLREGRQARGRQGAAL